VLIAGILSIGSGVLVAYFTIPVLGLIGIGIVYIAIKAVHFVVLVIVSQKYFKVHYNYNNIIKILVAAIVSIGVGIIFYFFVISGGIYTQIVVPFLISSILYVGLVFLFRLVKREDYDFVKSLVKTFIESRTTSA
jgi:hypothetical protein